MWFFSFCQAGDSRETDSAAPPPLSDRDKTQSPQGVQFNLERLHQVPEVVAADEIHVEGLKSLYYRGLDYQGHATRVFAFYGTPANPPEKKLPAMVLVHGGGGTAFADWVKLWNSRGYAAIAMDLCGCLPERSQDKWRRHDLGGPPGWDASFSQLDDPIDQQWTYQAVSAVVLAQHIDPFVSRSRCRSYRTDGNFLGRISDLHHRGRRRSLSIRLARLRMRLSWR